MGWNPRPTSFEGLVQDVVGVRTVKRHAFDHQPLGHSFAPYAWAGEYDKSQSQLGELDAQGQLAARSLAEPLIGIERQPGLFDDDLHDFLRRIGQISMGAKETYSFFAEADGEPIATGGLIIWEGVALLAGASTVPEGRKQGAQLALLRRRLEFAVEKGCDLAMMCVEPGSTS